MTEKIKKYDSHFKERLRERYGIQLTNRELKRIKEDILHGHTIHVKNIRRYAAIHIVSIRGRLVLVIADRNNNLRTALPPNGHVISSNSIETAAWVAANRKYIGEAL